MEQCLSVLRDFVGFNTSGGGNGSRRCAMTSYHLPGSGYQKDACDCQVTGRLIVLLVLVVAIVVGVIIVVIGYQTGVPRLSGYWGSTR